MNENVRSCHNCAKYPNCILRFDEDQRDSCPILKHEEAKLSYRNDEGYPDPTAFQALVNIEREKKRASRQARQAAIQRGKPEAQQAQQAGQNTIQAGQQKATQTKPHRKDKPKTRPIRPRTQVVHND